MYETMAILLSISVLIIVILLTIVAALMLFMLFYTRVPFVKSPKPVIRRIIKELNVTSNDTVYDLGCGDAIFLLEIEKETGAKTVGYEIAPLPYIYARFNVWRKKSKAKILYKNFYKEDLSGADVVFCFLLDTVMPKVGKHLEQQLKPGSRVVSFAFAIKAWEPVKVMLSRPDDPKSSKIYIYQR